MSAEVYAAAKFRLGKIVTTPNALSRLTQEEILLGIQRHQAGDWGDLYEHERNANDLAIAEGKRIWSVYHTAQGVKFWLITEANRSVTTVLLPGDGTAVQALSRQKSPANAQPNCQVLNLNGAPELTSAASVNSTFRISHYPNSRFWAVYDADELVAVTVYRRGAREVLRRLQAATVLAR